MKHYSCKECKRRGKFFGGTRREVRHHIRWDHLIKSGKSRMVLGDKHESRITPQMEVVETNAN